MAKLPVVTGREVISALCKGGFAVVRASGSHHILKKEGHRTTVSVPMHGSKTIKAGPCTTS